MFKKLLQKFDDHCSLYVLLKIIGVLMILYLLIRTQSVWGSWTSMFVSIMTPFVTGFVIAYIMSPLVDFLKRKGIPKNFSILAIWIILIILIIVLFVMLIPALYTKVNSFIVSIIEGVQWISNKIKEVGNFQDFSVVNTIQDSIIKLLEGYDDWLPQLLGNLPNWMTMVLDYLTNTLFTIIIAIYMMFDFKRIKSYIKKGIRFFFPNCDHYLTKMDEDVYVYIKSLIILVCIRLVEYCAFYFLVGHPDWLIIGIISALGTIVPYIGGTIANAIGLLTGLTLPTPNLIALLIGILILSNVDNYVISPIVHEKRSSLGPLLTIFVIFAGGVIYGPIGIMLSVPVTIMIKTGLVVYKQQHEDEIDKS